MNKYIKILIFFYALLLGSCSSVNKDFTNTEVNYSLTESIYSSDDDNFILTESYFFINEKITDADIIFFDNQVNIEGGYADKNYAVDFDMAIANIINTGIVSYDTKFLCLGTSILNDKIYYVIDTSYDNGDSVIAEEKFWVNTESGVVYVYFDPTLPVSEHFAWYKKQIDEDDFRSRLIKVSE